MAKLNAPRPETSVVLPVHNAGKFLRPAVESLLAQTYSNFELLLVDDHSTDGAIEGLTLADSRLSVLPSIGHGVVTAFHTGWLAARGEFVARMDADDLALPTRLAIQIAHLKQHTQLGIAGAQVELFGADELQGGNLRYQAWLNSLMQPEEIANQVFVECPIPNPTAIFRREVLEQLGGYRELDWPEDYDLFLRADRAGISMGKPEGILLRWREHPKRATHRDERYSRHNFQRAKVHHLVRGRLAGRPVVLMGAGSTGAALHDLLLEAGAEVQGFLDVHPRRVGGLKRGLPVWGYEQLKDPKLAFLLGAVGSMGARAHLRGLLAEHGREEGQGYLFMA